MDRCFRKHVVEYFATKELPGFQFVSQGAIDRLGFSARPLVFFRRARDTATQFVSIFPYRSSKLIVELGWKEDFDRAFPIADASAAAHVGRPTFADRNGESFSTRLFYLTDRSNFEWVWDLYLPEVWSPEKESFQEFTRRTAFLATGEALRVAKLGGISDQYASVQVKLICGDILHCMRKYGVPFLDS
jgi:hypothetical protein